MGMEYFVMFRLFILCFGVSKGNFSSMRLLVSKCSQRLFSVCHMDFARRVNAALSYKVSDATIVLINWLGESASTEE